MEAVLADPPPVHQGETEIQRQFAAGESLLDARTSERLRQGNDACYGVDGEVARFLAESLTKESRSLETGCGVSTLVCAMAGATHTTVTPNAQEFDRLRRYAQEKDIDLGKVTFVAERSEDYLPRAQERDLDLVLIDGKHAFPWPIIDWFFTADRLRRGGLMLIDDVQMPPVALLVEFLRSDPAWSFVTQPGSRTVVFRKERDSALDVAWHMQPFSVVAGPQPSSRAWAILDRVKGLLR